MPDPELLSARALRVIEQLRMRLVAADFRARHRRGPRDFTRE